jgi:hypothetical protein
MRGARTVASKEVLMLRPTFVLTLLLALGLSVAFVCAAEDKKAETPKPGPEHARLAYNVGAWRFEGEAKASSFGPGGKFSGTETCEWFSGEFAIVCRATSRGPMGTVKGMSILGYDPEEKVYTYYGIDSAGYGGLGKGSVTGDTWTWTGEMKVKGKLMKSRFTIKEVSRDSYTARSEISEDGGPWTVESESSGTREKSAPK